MKNLFYFLILLLCVSCTKQSSEFQKLNNCNNSNWSVPTEKVTDFLQKFKIEYPSHWKTQLFYDQFQSDIIIADTTKQLSETYLIDFTYSKGELSINPAFQEKVNKKLIEEKQISIVDQRTGKIQEKPFYMHIGKSRKNNLDYRILRIYIDTGVDDYLQVSADVYGDANVEQRVCEIAQIMDSIEFLH